MRQQQGVAGWLWQAVRIMAACGLAYGGSKLLGVPEGYWALITSIVVTQPVLDETLAAGRDRVLGTLIGAAVGLGVSEAARHGTPVIPLSLPRRPGSRRRGSAAPG